MERLITMVAKRRVASSLIVGAVSLLLAGCGSTAVAVTFKMHVWYSDIGATPAVYYVVISGNQGAGFDRAREINRAFMSGSGLIEESDGDRHEGDKVCEGDITKTLGGGPADTPYHVAVYADRSSMTERDYDVVKDACPQQ